MRSVSTSRYDDKMWVDVQKLVCITGTKNEGKMFLKGDNWLHKKN